MKIKHLLAIPAQPRFATLSLLLLRVVVGLAFMVHGWPKIQNAFAWMGPEAPIPGLFQALAAFSEAAGGLAWVLGLLTALAAVGIAATMTVAVFTHAVLLGDPFVAQGQASYELASVYLCIALLLIAMGPGALSLDRFIFGQRPR